MMEKFYGTNIGNLLVDKANYPLEIKQFLDAELSIVENLMANHSTLVEIGCMDGRFLDWAVKNNKNYIGLDIEDAYIDKANIKLRHIKKSENFYKFCLCDAKKLFKCTCLEGLQNALFFFPFNSFGNINSPFLTISNFLKLKSSFFISGYKTDKDTNLIRKEYYSNCKYLELQQCNTTIGTLFKAKEGLCTYSYHLKYISYIFHILDIDYREIYYSKIGLGYISRSNSPELERFKMS